MKIPSLRLSGLLCLAVALSTMMVWVSRLEKPDTETEKRIRSTLATVIAISQISSIVLMAAHRIRRSFPPAAGSRPLRAKDRPDPAFNFLDKTGDH